MTKQAIRACLCALMAIAAPALGAQDKAAEARALAQEGERLYKAGETREGLAKMVKAAELLRNRDALHRLGHFYERQTDMDGHRAEAIRLFGMAARYGDSDSMAHYGDALVRGDTVPRDHDLGVELLVAASALFYTPADAILADIEAKQRAGIECAERNARELGYRNTSLMHRDWRVVRSGSGEDSRGDILSIKGPPRYDYSSDRSARRYAAFDVKASGFTRMRIYAVGDESARLIQEEPLGLGPASAQGQSDAAKIVAQCRQ